MTDQPVAAEAAIAQAIRDRYADWDEARAEHPIYLDFVRLGIELSTFPPLAEAQVIELAESLATADDDGAFDEDDPDAEAGMAAFIVNALMAQPTYPLVTQAGDTRALIVLSPTGPVAVLVTPEQAEHLFDSGVNWEPEAPAACHFAIAEVIV